MDGPRAIAQGPAVAAGEDRLEREATLEKRMTVLEEAVRELRDAMISRQSTPDWLDRVIGSMKDEPAFDEVLEYGRAIRQADRLAKE